MAVFYVILSRFSLLATASLPLFHPIGGSHSSQSTFFVPAALESSLTVHLSPQLKASREVDSDQILAVSA